MWLLNRLTKKTKHPHHKDMGSTSNSVPQPPYDLLDRQFLFPSGMEVKVVGFQYGGSLIRIPFLVRCRVVRTHEIVLIDPLFIRHFGEDTTSLKVKREALRKPYVPHEEEVLRIIGWSSRTEFVHGVPARSDLVRIANEDRVEDQP